MGVQSPTLAQGLGGLTGLCQRSSRREEASRGPKRSLPQPVLLTDGQEVPNPALPPLPTRCSPRLTLQNQQSCSLARPPQDWPWQLPPNLPPSSPAWMEPET